MIARIRPETSYLNILKSFFANEDYEIKLIDKIKKYFGVKEVLLVSSARSGLYLLLKALSQERVYLPAYTCWVVPEAARLAKKKIFFIDINLQDYNLNVNELRKKITPGSIIIATHQFGIPCDIEKILIIAKEKKCLVIEDNAAGFGSEYKGKKTGSFAPASVISFEISKTLTSGKGGAILFNDLRLYKKVSNLYPNEIKKVPLQKTFKQLIYLFTYKLMTEKSLFPLTHMLFSRLKGFTGGRQDYLQEATGQYSDNLDRRLIKLAYLNWENINYVTNRRKIIAKRYHELLNKTTNISLPVYASFKEPVLMRFPIKVKERKQEFYQKCCHQGLDLAFTFSYSCSKAGGCYNSDKAAQEVLNLPIYSQLSDNDIQKIAKIIKDLN
ncbi:MAG: DegT/DnrJ/EryC1/StrS family aminotransferase [Patescibacteria group bacterium]|nr:DegT/DnrJ/EryC1/StrS family aminotransferase [Patescibacteria group bacterium]